MPSQLDNIGLALQGFGAGMLGQGPQFTQGLQANQNQQQEMQLKQQQLGLQTQEFQQRQAEQQQKMQQQVMQESYKDALIFNNFAKKGDWDSAKGIGLSFLQHAQMLQKQGIPVPPDAVEHAQLLSKLAIAATNKDYPDDAVEAAKQAVSHSDALVEQGRGLGILEKPKGESPVGKAAQDLRDGLISQQEYKDIVAKETGGDTAFLTEQKRQADLRKQLQADPTNKDLQQQLQDVTDHISELARPGQGGADKAGSLLGKAALDLQRGIITQDEYDALKAKETGVVGGKLGSREQVFLNRTLISANEAAKDLENVIQLPMTASTGIFGGRKQGSGLFDATKEVLANKMTGQDAQSYNVMATGFQRSLAGLESAGLAPAGSLTHQMDSVLFKEGDTNLTKLQKLAQTRQIVEASLESTLSNPRIPDEQRKHAEEVLASVQKAVPFTQKDLIHLQIAQDKDPNATLKDVMDRAKVGTPQPGTTQGGYRFKGGNPADKNNWEKL